VEILYFESYKFWRIYGGVKFSYLLYDRSLFTTNQRKSVITNNKDFNDFLYGLYLSGGYNTINLYAYYGLNPLFKTAVVNGQKS
jgi:membrane-anchored protein YejM (alkaline phosphatase superfamily)